MKKEFVRQIVVYGNYFKEFRKTLNKGALKKMYQVLTLIMMMDVVPSKFLKAVKNVKGLYEIRTEYEDNIYRVFCCFDDGDLVVLFNGFHKKTQRLPAKELSRAESIMREYFDQKRR